MKRTMILASGSPRRKELLFQIGFHPIIIPSEIEELITTEIPSQAVMELSEQKARDVAKRCEPGSIVIGADTVVSVNGEILGKPKSGEDALRMITMLQGRIHQVYTGVTLILCGEKNITFAEKTDVMVFPMTQEEILSYIETGEPMDKAGAYAIQGLFAAYIKEIHGDYSNVVGLPVGRVYQELKKLT